MANRELQGAEKPSGAQRCRARTLFEAALDLSRDQHAAFLARECEGDAELRRQVEALLNHDESADDGFLQPPPPDPRLDRLLKRDDPDPLLGQTIGEFTIQRTIATGGMGTVYLAEQANPRRNVALKVLHAGFWSRSAERRFEFESQILARLQHPNIAQVYAAGTVRLGGERGRPVHYFAMEYVPNARTITQCADERSLNTRQRLELFLQVCEAVRHGHDKGIIHRDLKPGNILVATDDAVAADLRVGRLRPAGTPGVTDKRPAGTPDATPRVKVIDFGVARAVDSDVALTTLHTDTGQLIGTLAYMSPEQCDADPLGLDVRSDIYSLGVTLYELLCGKLPYDVSKTSLVAAARTIRETEPARPSTTMGSAGVPARRISGDLEIIVLKCLEKERAKRYASVADLADDVRRTLRGEPVAARPPTIWTKAVRWAVRRPKTATLLVCALFVAGTAAATAVSRYVLLIQPYDIKMSEDHRTVRLVTRLGDPLTTWDAGVAKGISFARFFSPDECPQNGPLVVIGFAPRAQIYSGELCAFAVNGDRKKPLWRHRVEPEDLPTDETIASPARHNYGVEQGLVADIFPEVVSPGLEIVAVFSHARSRRAIRIYDLGGTLRFQVWQDGGIWDCHWMREAGLLIFLGGDEREKDRAHAAKADVDFVPVLFAVKPAIGLISKDYIGRDATDPRLRPVWYRYFKRPLDAKLRYDTQFSTDALGSYDDGRHAAIEVKVPNRDRPDGTFTFVVDEHGREVPESRLFGDYWEKNKAKLPPDSDFRLRDDPPVYRPAR